MTADDTDEMLLLSSHGHNMLLRACNLTPVR